MTQNWIKNTKKEILDKIEELPDNFSGFKSDLLAREDMIGDVLVHELVDLSWSDHFGFAKFLVSSEMVGDKYFAEYISRRNGKCQCLRGVVLLKVNGKITHFVIRKCQRFGLEQEVYESLGNIYQTNKEFSENKFSLSEYIKDETTKIMHIDNINVDRFFDLGNVYTDVSMFNNIVRIFAMTIEVKDVKDISNYTDNKLFNKTLYSYKIEIIPIEKFYEFFVQVSDSVLLAIFGRLQALNVIKL